MDSSLISIIENTTSNQSDEVNEAIRSRARVLANRLRLPLSSANANRNDEYEFALRVSQNELSLCMAGPSAPSPLRVDFENPALNFRIEQGLRRQAIARATGVKPGIKLRVVDGTAGLGKDAFLLASLGCDVVMIERDPVIHALLEDGVRRARESGEIRVKETVARLELRLGDFTQDQSKDSLRPVDVVYLDPMFPSESMKARSKKDMFYLQQYLATQPQPPEEELLEHAMDLAVRRVVVKRSKRAPCLHGVNPSHVLPGGSSRFDVYMVGHA